MPAYTVEVEGTPLDSVSHVERNSGDETNLGTAKVECSNTSTNRAVESGDDAVIKRDGSAIFRGQVTKAPTQGRTGEQLEFTFADKRIALKYIESHRPFYQMDPGEILREAVNKAAQVRSPTFIHQGDTPADWSSDVPEWGLLSTNEKQLHDYGGDAMFFGFPGDSEGNYYARYESVPANAIPGDGQIVRLTTRILVNNRGDQIQTEIDLRDNAGNNYIWPVEATSTNFKERDYKAENAVTTASIGSRNLSDGTLEYRFRLKGVIPEPRAVGIDMAQTLPFVLKNRSAPISTTNVEDTGHTITRRIDGPVLETLQTFAVEEGYSSWVDANDDLHFEPAGGVGANLSITEGSTPVTEAEFNRDYDDITNKVTVQGSGDVQVTAVDQSSVKFYGLSEREEQIVDSELQTDAEATRRAEGFLQENAWDDGAMAFEIADGQYEDVVVGQTILVTWPSEDINSSYLVSGVETDEDGFVTVKIGGAQLG